MQPNAGSGRDECVHPVRQQTSNETGENVARTAGCQLRRPVDVDCGAAIGRCDDSVRTFEEYDCLALSAAFPAAAASIGRIVPRQNCVHDDAGAVEKGRREGLNIASPRRRMMSGVTFEMGALAEKGQMDEASGSR